MDSDRIPLDAPGEKTAASGEGFSSITSVMAVMRRAVRRPAAGCVCSTGHQRGVFRAIGGVDRHDVAAVLDGAAVEDLRGE